MWTLTIRNDYAHQITAFGRLVDQGTSYTFPEPFGSGVITVPGLDQINFLDIGDKQIGGFSKATWGVLITFHGEEVVFRYEGGGQIQVHLNWLGQAELSGNGAFCPIQLPTFILPPS